MYNRLSVGKEEKNGIENKAFQIRKKASSHI